MAEAETGAQLLLVLDNCEHVIDVAARMCAGILERDDDVQILATSREPLGVHGETHYRIAPPDLDSGVQLFLDRVRLTIPGFVPDEEAAGQIARVVARLDGLPLAIELAAARVEALGLAELLRQLDDPLGVLTGGSRTAPARQQSLRSAIAWSYHLITEPQREVFRRLAVLPAPFTLTSALAVGGEHAEAAVPSLVHCSLVAAPERGTDGRDRYTMLAGLCAFAREQLAETGEEHDAMQALVACALSIAEAAAERVRAPGGEVAGAQRFDADSALLHRALRWCLDEGDHRASRLALAMAPWWQLRGRIETGYELLGEALRDVAPAAETWAAGQKWLGRLAHSMASWDLALKHFTVLCDLARAGTELVDGLVGRSGTLRNLGALSEAIEVALKALWLARELHYAEGEVLALAQISLATGFENDPEEGRAWARQAEQIDAALLPDKVARRRAVVMTVALIDAGDLEAARAICADGLASARAAGDVPVQADFLYFTTTIALRSGDVDDAGRHIHESLQLTAASGDRLRMLDCLDDCAHLCARTDRFDEALTLWAARDARLPEVGTPDLSREVVRRSEPRELAREQLGVERRDEAERRGAAMTLRTACEFAAMLTDSSPSAAPPIETGADDAGLTAREREVITLVARGHTDAQIASELFISIRTVRSHLDRIRDKTGSRRRADLTRLALGVGLV
jgi:predicted ATPase/DNA-binding CsgD family transcriptional regulator